MNDDFCSECGASAGHGDRCSVALDEARAEIARLTADAERRAAIDRLCCEQGCDFTGSPPHCYRCGRYDRAGIKARADLRAALERETKLREALTEIDAALKKARGGGK